MGTKPPPLLPITPEGERILMDLRANRRPENGCHPQWTVSGADRPTDIYYDRSCRPILPRRMGTIGTDAPVPRVPPVDSQSWTNYGNVSRHKPYTDVKHQSSNWDLATWARRTGALHHSRMSTSGGYTSVLDRQESVNSCYASENNRLYHPLSSMNQLGQQDSKFLQPYDGFLGNGPPKDKVVRTENPAISSANHTHESGLGTRENGHGIPRDRTSEYQSTYRTATEMNSIESTTAQTVTGANLQDASGSEAGSQPPPEPWKPKIVLDQYTPTQLVLWEKQISEMKKNAAEHNSNSSCLAAPTRAMKCPNTQQKETPIVPINSQATTFDHRLMAVHTL